MVQNDDSGLEVSFRWDTYVVVLEAKSCLYIKQDLTQILCPHAICAINQIQYNSLDYVHNYYSKSTYLQSFENMKNQ